MATSVVLAGPSAGPAGAAACSSTHGVTVVVDFHELGGGVQQGCDVAGAGEEAAQQFTDLGHTLTYAQRQPGFVCRVDAVPASDPCVNTSPGDAYWALWWSDGTSGTWTYSSLGAGSLKVPDGGSVAFSWSQGDGQHPPGVAPARQVASTPHANSHAYQDPHPVARPHPCAHEGAGPHPGPDHHPDDRHVQPPHPGRTHDPVGRHRDPAAAVADRLDVPHGHGRGVDRVARACGDLPEWVRVGHPDTGCDTGRDIGCDTGCDTGCKTDDRDTGRCVTG